MGLVRKLFIGLVVLILLMGVIGFLLPASGHVEREIVIDAPAQTVFDVVRDFDQFNAWSPWHGLDPDARYEQSGTRGEVGSRFAWYSEKPEVGNGTQTITALNANSLVAMDLTFEGQSPATSEFRMSPEGSGTRVVWTLDTNFGANP
ncbi:MAG: SRPBCC family protein, partial [Pseudomonadota bacterium]